jgi:hypothetical protein
MINIVNKIIDGRIWHEKYTDFKLRDFDESFKYYGDNLEAEKNITHPRDYGDMWIDKVGLLD